MIVEYPQLLRTGAKGIRWLPLVNSDKQALVDACFYGTLSKYRWRVRPGQTKLYVATTSHQSFSLHRWLLNALAGQQVDHINGDTLDNREVNLRFATKTQNQANAGKYRNNTSGYRGVSWDASCGKWRSQIKFQKRLIHLGVFSTTEAAAIVHDAAAIWLHGALFVRRNLPHRIIDPNVFTHIQQVFEKQLRPKSS